MSESVCAHLREQIVTCCLKPGDALPEARLGELFGVSRAPVREALALLEREGLVTFDRRGTARVCLLGPEDVRELGLMRLALEPIAARLTCERLTPEIRAEIEDNLHALQRAKALAAVTRLDLEFHRLILRASGNRRLLVAWEGLAGQFLLVIARLHRAVERRTHEARASTHRSHAELFAALAGSDPDRAEALARRHATDWLAEWEKLHAFQVDEEASS
jgi:DNA-binding GntR family transcriptional regulator